MPKPLTQVIEFEFHGVTLRYDKGEGLIRWGARAWRLEVAPLHLRIEVSRRMAQGEIRQDTTPRRVQTKRGKRNAEPSHYGVSARAVQRRNK